MDLNLGSTRALIDECRRQGLLRNQCAYVLATAYHETAHTMMPIHERGAKAYFNKYEPGTKIGKNLGNTKKGDGYLYRGRGFVQLTGRANYAKYGIEDNPEAALDPNMAALIAVKGMKAGTFTGKKLSTYLTADKTDYLNARRIINGKDRAQLIAGYASKYEMDLEVIGYAQKKPASARPAPVVTIPPIEPKPVPAPAPELVPIKVPGVDKPMVQSTTMWAALSGTGMTALAGSKDYIDSLTGLDWRVTMTIVGLAAAFAAYWIISERVKYRRAQRDMVAGVKAASAEQ